MSEKKERKIIISLHQKGEDELAPKVETVGEVKDFEWLFAIAKLTEMLSKTPDSEANGEEKTLDMIAMAVTSGVQGRVNEYVKLFIDALIEQRKKEVVEEITKSLKAIGFDVVPSSDKRICNGEALVFKLNTKEDEKDEG